MQFPPTHLSLIRILAVIALASLALSTRAAPPSPLPTDALLAKADASLLKKLAAQPSIEFFAVMRDQANVEVASSLVTREQKGRFVFEQLQSAANASQAEVRRWLDANGIPHRPYWIVNAILVDGGIDVAASLAERDDIVKLSDNPQVRMPMPVVEIAPKASTATTAVEWGVAKIRAPELWAGGFTGQGIVVASADTGVDWTHPGLRAKYRGWDGTQANHDYNWHDAIHAPNVRCGASTTAPCDDGLHGTHTVGTMVGDDGAGNQVGVAPGARWIGCRNMNNGVGTPATYIECFQFFLAPTTIAGTNPDPSKAPDVVNNSWGCPVSEGCVDVLVLEAATKNLKAAGITVVTSAGNAGAQGCFTINDPIAIYSSAFSVGATDINDTIAFFSSRGPVTVDGSGRRKPDVSAPGVSVRSTIPGPGYTTLQGTSMASPHVAGAVALLLSGRAHLRGRPSDIQRALEASAVPRSSSVCESNNVAAIPNNTYGWGRIDVRSAFDLAIVPSIDVDESRPISTYDALTDGLLIVRHLFGIGGEQLARSALSPAAKRTDPAAIGAYIDAMGFALDIDGDGRVDALTDGMLVLRYLFGLRGDRLIDGAVAPGATRSTPALIERYIRTLMP